jgi:hypothetical protein
MSSHQWLKSQKSNTILPEQKFEKFFRILMLLVQRLPNKIGFVSNAKLLDVLAPLMATWLSITP